MPLRHEPPAWGRWTTLALALVCALAVPVYAQPKKKQPDPTATPATNDPKDKPDKAEHGGGEKKAPKVKNFDLNAIDLNGRNRTPQLLYFLERANEELERASLEKRSFIPHLVRSLDEEQL
jgi:hypothetical protein